MAGIEFRVDAVLGDTSKLEQQLQNFKSNLELKIDATQAIKSIDNVKTRINKMYDGLKSSDIAKRLGVREFDSLDQKVQHLANNMAKVTQQTITTNNKGDITGAVLTYKDAVGNTVQETLKWQTVSTQTTDGIVTNNQKLVTTQLKYKDNIEQTAKALQKEQDAIKNFNWISGDKVASGVKGVSDIANTDWFKNLGQSAEIVGGVTRSINAQNQQIEKTAVRVKTADNQWQKYNATINTSTGEMRVLKGQTSDVVNSQMNLSTMLTSAIERFAVWGVAMKIWTGVGNAISDCIGYISDLDGAMTNIRVVTMDTKEATQDLLQTYNQLGQELGANTLDIAEGAVDWLRQGYNEADTTELVKDSTILSKLALIENAQATEYLTSALKGYKLEASDAIGVIDQLVAIDLEAATSAGDMAEAMSRTANLANNTGFEMNELLGIIATVSEVTQNSASTVGNSMKTLLSRMSNVKAGVEDFDGESLNDVEKVLNRVGIALRDNQGNWYDFYDVLAEVASRWESFSDVQQSQITTALGGTRQRENILVAIENWDKVQQYAKTGADSAGTAMAKYDIVLESVSAKQEQLNAKVQEFYMNMMNSSVTTGLLDIGQGLMDIANIGDGLVGKLALITAGTIALVAVLESLKKSGITGFSTLIAKLLGVTVAEAGATSGAYALKGALDVLSSHPIILAITAITTALTIGVTAWNTYQESIQESIDKANELTETYKSSTQELQDNINALSTPSDTSMYATLADEFEALSKGVDQYGNNISLTTDQYSRYKAICEQIVGLNPSLMDGYDSETEAIGNKNSKLQETIDLLRQQQIEEAKTYAKKSNETLGGFQNQYDKDLEEAIKAKDDIAQKIYQLGYNNGDIGAFDGWTSISALQKNIDKILEDSDKYYEELASWFRSLNYSEEYIDSVKVEYDEWIEGIKAVQNDFSDEMNDTYKAVAKSMEGYYDLGTHTKGFLNDYIENSFKLDPSLSEEEAQKAVDANKKTVEAIVTALEGENGDQIEKALGEFYKIDPDNIKYDDYEKQSQEIAQRISDVLQTDLTGDGLIDEADVGQIKIALDADVDVDKIKQRTNEINGLLQTIMNNNNKDGKFDIFGDITDDIGASAETLKNTNPLFKEFSDYLEGLSLTELDRAKLALQQFGDSIANVDDLKSYVQKFADIDSALNRVSDGFARATQKADAFKQKLSNITEYDTNFNSYTSAIEALEKEFEKGTVGSKTFAEATKYLLGDSFDVTNVDAVREKLGSLKEIFADGSYGEGFINALDEANLKLSKIKQNADGTWDFDLDTSEKGIKEMADALGITEEGVWSCIEAMQMLGDVDLFDSDTIKDFAEQFGKLGEFSEDVEAINVDGLRKSLDDAGISTANLDDALKELSDNGVVLLDISAEADVLKDSLSQIGLVANDNVVNVDNLVSSLSSIGYTNDQIASVLTSLQSLEGESQVTFQVSDNGTVDDVIAKLQTTEDKTSEVDNSEATPTVTVEGVDTANAGINSVRNNLNSLDGKTSTTKIITKYVSQGSPPSGDHGLNGIGNNFKGSSHLNGTAFTGGRLGAKRTETALVGEVEPEIWVHADTGQWELVTNPQFLRIKKGDVIFNGQQTKDLLGKGSSSNFGRSFLKGTAYVSSSGWGNSYGSSGGSSSSKKKKKTSNSNSSNSSSSSKSKSSSTDKEWWEEQLEKLKDNLDYNVITMDTYIDGLGDILSKLKKGSDAWNEINKELQKAKLDNIENQFDRGEITIDEYIKKLGELRKSYKKNTEGYKELTQTINEAKLDKFESQYERGEISANQYINKLKSLQSQYKKGSEEYKKLADEIDEIELEKTEKFLDKLQAKLDRLDQEIDEMGDINTDKESVKYAELLSKKYIQVQKDIVSIKQQLANTNLTQEQREALQEELNDLLVEEVDIRDEIEDQVRDYYENQKEQAEKQAELNRKQTLYFKEVELYGEKGKELFEWETNKKIKAIDEEIERRQDERDALDEINEREELENNLLEARLKLQNALNNKTTKILKKQADGTWQYEYSANMTDVKEAQDEIKEAEKALDDYVFEQSIQKLQDEADKLNDTMSNLAEQYEDAEFWADRKYEKQLNIIEQQYGDIDSLVESWMEENGKDSSSLLTNYQSLVESNNTLNDALVDLTTALEAEYETVGNNKALISNNIASRLSQALSNALIGNLPSSFKGVDVTKFDSGLAGALARTVGNISSTTSSNSSMAISKVECVFPNITSTEGLQKAILELPRLALQKK